MPDQAAISWGEETGPWDGGTNHTFVFGPVAKDATEVILRFANGAEIVIAPRDPGSRFRFSAYVFEVGQQDLADAVVVARNDRGEELGRAGSRR